MNRGAAMRMFIPTVFLATAAVVNAHVTLSNTGGIHDQQYVMNVTGAYLQTERRYPLSLRYTLSPSSSSSAPVSPNSNETCKPNEPPSFAAANPGPARAVPTGPVRPMPIGKETSTTNSPGANQVGDMSQYVSAGGITIPRDLPGAPKGRGVFPTPISLRGNPAFATLKYSGRMECTADGRLGGGTDKFKPTQIQTSKNPDKWLTVSSFSIGKDGFLVVTDESGTSYKIKLPPILSRNSGTIEELGKTSH